MSDAGHDRIDESFEALRSVLERTAAGNDSVHPAIAFSLPTLGHIHRDGTIAQALLRPGDEVRRRLHVALVREILAALQANSGELPAPQRQVAEFVAGSFVSLCMWWLEDAPDTDPESIDEVFRALATAGLEG